MLDAPVTPASRGLLRSSTRRRSPRLRARHCYRTFLALAASLVLTGLPDTACAQNLTEAQVNIVVERLADGARQSWELGTQQQSLIELNTPSFSVLNDTSLPPSTSFPSSLTPVLTLITTVIQNQTHNISAQNLSYPQQFFPNDGSAADSASNGVAALIANWTGQNNNASVDYGGRAVEEMAFLWSGNVPKTDEGAFSHRRTQVQLWSDFVYMVPPFLAYYGVLTSNRSMVESAYNQISLYRDALRDKNTDNLWKHVVLGSDFQDEGFWSTGNGWAAAGMLRVLGTIQNSQYRNAMKGEVKDLRKWVNEIHDGMFLYLRDDGLFHNYATDNSTFTDASSAALLASTVYRHALLSNTYKHLPNAEFIRSRLWSSNSSSSSTSSFVNSSSLANMTHFDANGWLTPVVDPYSFGKEGRESPEGQAFVVMMYSAWRDWLENGGIGANAGRRTWGEVPGVFWAVGVGVGVGVVVFGV